MNEFEYQRIAHKVVNGAGWTTRGKLARDLGIHITTAEAHLKRAVRDGLLVRVWAWDGKHMAWVYCAESLLPSEQQALFEVA